MRTVWRLLLTLALFAVAAVPSLSAPAAQAAPSAPATTTPVPQVDVFGDSVTWESEIFIAYALQNRAQVNFYVYPGTSLCMWFDQMKQAAAAKPSMVLMTFASWPGRSCDHTSDPYRETTDDAGTAATIFKGIPIVFAADPIASTSTPALQQKLNQAYQAAVRTHKNARFNNPGATVTNKGAFTTYLPCLPDETASYGCINAYGGVIKVRAPDGVHLCPVIPPTPGHCPMYSSGERRFGTALAAPAVNKFSVRQSVSQPKIVKYEGVKF
jgi:hypothetical protein